MSETLPIKAASASEMPIIALNDPSWHASIMQAYTSIQATLNHVVALLTEPSIWIALFAFLSAYLLGKKVKRRARSSIRASLKTEFADFVLRLTAPLLALPMMLALCLLAKPFGLDEPVFAFFFKLALAWLAIKTVLIMSTRQSAGWMIAIVIAPITLLQLFDLWLPLVGALENISLSVGKFNLSLLAALKTLVVVTILFWLTGRVVTFVQSRIIRMKNLHVSHRQLLDKIFQIVLYFIVFLIVMQMLGIDLTALSVFGGALGVGLGFGLQKIASNFISGIILLLEKSIQVGDVIELQDGTVGNVRKTGARYTLMETTDGREVLIPNEDFITQRTISWTHSNKRARVEIVVGVAYQSDLDKVRALMLHAAQMHPMCLNEPKPMCVCDSFGESAIIFRLFFWIPDIDSGRMEPKSDVLLEIWRSFRAEGIEIPLPQRQVHILEKDPA